MTAARVARDMREYIEEHGWIQGQEKDHITGAVCLVGALYSVTHLEIAFRRAFAAKTGTPVVAAWNDAPGRTYEDVILLLKQIETGEE